MSPDSTKSTDSCPNSTATKRTAETTRETHLASLSDLMDWLRVEGERERGHRSSTPVATDLDFKMGEWAETVRWAIDRERSRS